MGSVCETSLYYVLLALQDIYGCSSEKGESRDREDGSEVLCGESEKNLKVMVGHFIKVCRRG